MRSIESQDLEADVGDGQQPRAVGAKFNPAEHRRLVIHAGTHSAADLVSRQ